MISRNYDVLVIDPSPGALTAGALLARAGLSVLVLGDEGTPPGAGSFRFLRHRPPVAGFVGGLLLPRTLKALKFHPHGLQAMRRGTPGLQVITTKHRLDIPQGPGELEAELKREFGAEAPAILDVITKARASASSFADALDRAVDDAGQTGLLTNLGLTRPDWSPPLPPEDLPTWGEFLTSAHLSATAESILRALVRPFCGLDVVEDLPLPVAGLHLAAALDGVFADPGEESPLLALLKRRVQAMRVDVLPDKLIGLEGNKRRIEAAVFEGRAEEMPVQFVITGGDPEDLLPLLPGAPRAYERVLHRLAPSHFRYSIFLGVREGVIPPDLAEHAILVDDGPDAVDEPGGCVLLSVSPPGSPLAPDGHRSLTLSTLVPYSEDGGLPDGLDAVAGRMLDRLKWLVPWLERHLEVLQVPIGVEVDDEHPIAVDPRPVAYTPAVAPADDPVASGLGVSMPHRNLFCAGPAALPALGLGGECLAGRLVERLALAKQNKGN